MKQIEMPLFKMNNLSSEMISYKKVKDICVACIKNNNIDDNSFENPRVSDYLIELNKIVLLKHFKSKNSGKIDKGEINELKRSIEELFMVFECYREIIYFEAVDFEDLSKCDIYNNAKKTIDELMKDKSELYKNINDYKDNCVFLIMYYFEKIK